jgi:superfamily II DNA or RNA helicase
MQQCGRGFRRYEDKESCKIILIKDSSHKWTKQHFKAQCKILEEEYGVIPLKINV